MSAIGYMTHTVRFDEILIGDRVRIPVGKDQLFRNVVVRRIRERPDGSFDLAVHHGGNVHLPAFSARDVTRGIALVLGDS